jgi:hypothetical protein
LLYNTWPCHRIPFWPDTDYDCQQNYDNKAAATFAPNRVILQVISDPQRIQQYINFAILHDDTP